jgi:hypothetical protein
MHRAVARRCGGPALPARRRRWCLRGRSRRAVRVDIEIADGRIARVAAHDDAQAPRNPVGSKAARSGHASPTCTRISTRPHLAARPECRRTFAGALARDLADRAPRWNAADVEARFDFGCARRMRTARRRSGPISIRSRRST